LSPFLLFGSFSGSNHGFLSGSFHFLSLWSIGQKTNNHHRSLFPSFSLFGFCFHPRFSPVLISVAHHSVLRFFAGPHHPISKGTVSTTDSNQATTLSAAHHRRHPQTRRHGSKTRRLGCHLCCDAGHPVCVLCHHRRDDCQLCQPNQHI